MIVLSLRRLQRSNAARVRNMSRLNGGKSRENSKHFFEKSNDKGVSGKRSFKRPIAVEKFLFFLSLTLSPRTLFCLGVSSKAFLQTSLRKRFELIQTCETLTTRCDVV